MTLTAQASTYSWGGQSAKETVAALWYRHRVLDGDLAEISDERMGQPEVGGTPVPTLPYRAGYMVGGGLSVYPRFEDVFGWILYGAMGSVTTTADTPEIGMHQHKFGFAANPAFMNYMSFRRHLVGAAAAGAEDLGTVYEDGRIIGLTFNLPNSGIPTARVDVLAREFTFEDPSAWSYVNTMEDPLSVPISCTVGGYIKIPGYDAANLPVIGAQIAIQNVPLDIRQEMVYGSPKLDDVTPVFRNMTVTLTLKWADPDLWRTILTGAVGGASWITAPFIEDLDIVALSPADITGKANPYSLRIQASNVVWQPVGGIRLAGNESVMLSIRGVAFDNPGGDYNSLTLENEVTAYAWPV